MEKTTGPRAAAFARALLVTVTALLVVPVWYGALVSLKDYQPFSGLAESPWTGWAAYREILHSPIVGSAVGGGLLLSAAGFACAALLGGTLGWFVPRIRGRGRRHIALGLLLAPTFVPNICWAVGLSPALAEAPCAWPWLFIAVTAVSGAGLIGFFGAAFAMARPAGGFLAGLGWAALLSVFTCLTPDTELLWLTRPSSACGATETLDAYAWRAGLLNLDLRGGAAAFTLKLLLQGLMGAVVCFGVYRVFLRGRTAPLDTVVRESPEMPFAAWVSAAAVPMMAGWVTLGGRLDLTGEAIPPHGLPAQTLSTALAFAVALPVAWAVIASARAMRYGAFCAVSGLLLCAPVPYVGVFLLFRQMGFVGAVAPTAALALFTPKGMLFTLLCARLAGEPRLAGRSAWPLALMSACLAAATAWGDSLTPATYILSPNLYPLSLWLQKQATEATAVGAAGYLLTLLAPLLLCGACGAAAFRAMRREATE